MKKLTLMVLLSLAACGTPVEAQLQPTVLISAVLAADTAGLTISVYGPTLSSGVALPCNSLTTRNESIRIAPDDARLNRLARVDVSFSAQSEPVLVEGIAPGAGRVVYVEAQNAAAEVIGVGCADNITIIKGQVTEDVAVEVFCTLPDCLS